VGNTGSHFKFKYGPLGDPVNRASRVQGATKYFNCPLLVTEATWVQVKDRCPGRRVGRVKLQGIEDPVDLYELGTDLQPEWEKIRTGYELALTEYEHGQFGAAARRLGQLLLTHAGDGPMLALLARVVPELVSPSEPFDPVWELPGK
jgi:adenylate cyclase